MKERIRKSIDKVKSNDRTKEKMYSNIVKSRVENEKIGKKRIASMRWIPIVAILIMMMTVTALATKNLFLERMQSISNQKKQEYVTELQRAEVHADSFSRKFTKSENERIENLRKQYEQSGMFPKGEIKKVEGDVEIEKNTLALIIDESKFVLPERELTDEEILEILDFQYQRDYSLLAEREKETQEMITNITEEEAVEMAKCYIGEIYEISLDDFKMENEIDGEKDYVIVFKNSKNDEYSVIIDTETKQVSEIQHPLELSDYDNSMVLNEKELSIYNDSVHEILKDKLNVMDKTTDVYCEYYENSDGTIYKGNIQYIAKLKDGTCWIVKYSLKREKVYNVVLTSYDSYAENKNNNDQKFKNVGIKRKQIKVPLKR